MKKEEAEKLIGQLLPLYSPIPWQVNIEHRNEHTKYKELVDDSLRAGDRENAAKLRDIAEMYRQLNLEFAKQVVPIVDLALSDPEFKFDSRLLTGDMPPFEAANLVGQYIAILRSRSKGAKPKMGRRKKSESGSREAVLSALASYHGLREDGSVENPEPATQQQIAERSGVSRPTISRVLGALFDGDGYRRYKAACRDQRIGRLLLAWRGEMNLLSRIVEETLQDRERGEE